MDDSWMKTLVRKFTEDKYFQGRPSSVDYNATGFLCSNKAQVTPNI